MTCLSYRANGEKGNIMNAVQKIKARHEAREWADIEGIWRSIKPALEANVERRREVEARRAGIATQQQAVENARTELVNLALCRAGLPFQVL